jgi:hypothetical protein
MELHILLEVCDGAAQRSLIHCIVITVGAFGRLSQVPYTLRELAVLTAPCRRVSAIKCPWWSFVTVVFTLRWAWGRMFWWWELYGTGLGSHSLEDFVLAVFLFAWQSQIYRHISVKRNDEHQTLTRVNDLTTEAHFQKNKRERDFVKMSSVKYTIRLVWFVTNWKESGVVVVRNMHGINTHVTLAETSDVKRPVRNLRHR